MTEGRQTDTAASANESAWPISAPSAWTVGIRDGTRAIHTPGPAIVNLDSVLRQGVRGV